MLRFTTVFGLPAINIAYDIHLTLQGFRILALNNLLISGCKLNCLFNGIHCLVTSIRFYRLVQKLFVLPFVLVLLAFPFTA